MGAVERVEEKFSPEEIQAIKRDRKSVIVTDIDIPFTRLVELLVKIAFASIPATFILAVFGAIMGFAVWTSLCVMIGH